MQRKKFYSCLFMLMYFNFGFSQLENGHGRLIIDKTVEKKFFKRPPIRIGSTINSYVRNVNGSFPLFDTCKSYFLQDTLIIEFADIMSFYRYRMKLIIINDKFYAYYMKENQAHPVTPISLKFRKRIKRKGQEIIGEVEISVQEPDTNIFRSLNGPFRCTVGKK